MMGKLCRLEWRHRSRDDSITCFKRFRSAICATLFLLVVGIAPLAKAASYTFTDLGTLGGTYSFAFGINSAGQVVGRIHITDDSAERATLWNATVATDLNSFLDASTQSAGWYLRDATGMDDSGWITGTALNTLTTQVHAFLLTPILEPEIYAMMLAGLALPGLIARRRKQQALNPLRQHSHRPRFAEFCICASGMSAPPSVCLASGKN
jgi:hypothetical protein